MKNDMKIIISNSKQVALSQEILKTNDQDYSQWKIIDLIYKDIYEGIQLSKMDDHLVIHALSFEIRDPISFSDDYNEWSTQVSAPNESFSVTFSGSSPLELYEIIRMLFKDGLEIQFFRNSHPLLFKKGSYPYLYSIQDTEDGSKKRKTLTIDDGLPLSTIHVRMTPSVGEKGADFFKIIHFTKVDMQIYEYERFCCLNYSRRFNNMKDTLSFIKKESHILFQNSLVITNPSLEARDTLKTESMNVTIIEISNVDQNAFFDILENVIKRLFYDLAIHIPFMIFYNEKRKELEISYQRGVFSLFLSRYFTESLGEKYKINDYNFETVENVKNTIRIEDQQGHTFQYRIGRMVQADCIKFPLSTKRIILLHGKSLFHSTVKMVSKEKEKEEYDYNIHRDSDDDEENIFSIKDKSKRQFKRSRLHELIETWKMNKNNEIGMEITFDNENDKIIVNKLELQTPMIKVTGPIFLNQRSYYRWNLRLIHIKNGLVVGEKWIVSHEIPLYLWENICKNLFISIKKVSSSSSSSSPLIYKDPYGGNNGSNSNGQSLEIKRITRPSHRIDILRLLMAANPIYEIEGIRLKHEFDIEIDLVKPENCLNLLKFINTHLRENFDYKIGKFSLSVFGLLWLAAEGENNPANPIYLKRLDGIHSERQLDWDDAIRVLLAPTRKPSEKALIVRFIERKGNYYHSFTGNVTVFYYESRQESDDDHFILEKCIKILKRRQRQQIMRIGRVENYKDTNISFLFAQYSINMNTNWDDDVLSFEKDFTFFSFDLKKIEGIGEVVSKIIENIEKISLMKDQLP